ncbi:MAG: leucyl/phenylalanyl-tRNA--protein transferase [Candidatus Competibacterales bacterium]|nr:leucyl/phenylalanyl-tRNA--protein transferase [Candidatus Competibacterales bacterium]
MTRIPWLNPDDRTQPFPDPHTALKEPNGLVAVGGCLSPERLIQAYSQGIFPWFDESTPICWWSPEPRTVLFPEHLKVSRSLRKTLRHGRFRLTLDQDFAAVLAGCSGPRTGSRGTWITPEMKHAYQRLHELGFAHSVETRLGDELVGGLYGVCLSGIFFGESMFSWVSDASKVALAGLCAHMKIWGFRVIDCQMPTAHLHSLGAIDLPRHEFLTLLRSTRLDDSPHPRWQLVPNWPSKLGF